MEQQMVQGMKAEQLNGLDVTAMTQTVNALKG